MRATDYKLAHMAAPPKSAAAPTAAVFMGTPNPRDVVLVGALEAEAADPELPVPGPVAVDAGGAEDVVEGKAAGMRTLKN